MSSQVQEDTPLVGDVDPPFPWTQWLDASEMLIYVEFAFSDIRQKIAATRKTKFGEIKETICKSTCARSGQLSLWWMGDEMQDNNTLEDAFGWRLALETTLHCEDRQQRVDRGLKRSRSSRSPGRGVDLCSIRGVDLCSILHPRSK